MLSKMETTNANRVSLERQLVSTDKAQRDRNHGQTIEFGRAETQRD